MEIINHTTHPHLLFRANDTMPDKMIAAVVVKVLYKINDEGICKPIENKKWLPQQMPWQSAFGPMDGDYFHYKGGVDIFVFGDAVAKNGKPAHKVDVHVKLPGKIDHKISVFGDRQWEAGFFGGISSTPPKPFVTMPLTLANAFGGHALFDEAKVPHPVNPHGKGYYYEKEQAIGAPLPNIENPASLITSWNDKPATTGVCAVTHCERKVMDLMKNHDPKNIAQINPRVFNNAFFEMIVPEIKPGEKISISGVQAEREFICVIPNHSIQLQLQFGEAVHQRPLKIEQVGIDTRNQELFISYRFPFEYTIRPGEQRMLSLTELN